MLEKNVLLEIDDLRVSFRLDEGIVQAVDGVSLLIKPGQILGIVGESGCGKTVTAQAIMRIIPKPGRIDSGRILFYPTTTPSNGDEQNVLDLAKLNPAGKQIRNVRGQKIAMIFQEPMSSFSALYTIGNQVMEPLRLHRNLGKREAQEQAIELLDRVGIANAARRFHEYPHEFSGGMRQRAMIARALSCSPALLIADEPTTALDVTIQAQILNMMRELQEQFEMAIMFITHNLGVIAQIADDVAIMYLGRVAEQGSAVEIFDNPKHPYTMGLLRAVPRLGKTVGKRLDSIKGVVPSPYERPAGCAFHPRCPKAINGRCDVELPGETQVGTNHTVYCFLYE
jgi:peptide/nickel transport system ATP-binding protein